MKILYVASTDLSGATSSAGSVRHIMEVAENLCRMNNEVRLIVPDHARYARQTPVRILYVPIARVRFLRTILFELLSPLYILAACLLWRAKVVYWRQSYLTVTPVLLSRLLGRPIIAEVNGLTIDEVRSEQMSAARRALVLALERFNYRHATHLICVAPRIRERIMQHYRCVPGKMSVIRNGVNAERMPIIDTASAKQQIGLDPSSPVVGFVGHLFPWDGIEYLIKAAPSVLRAVPAAKFVVVGHGKWGGHLPRMAAEEGAREAFIFAGKVEWEKLYLYVNAFDIATAPYAQAINQQSGRSSLKILEYLACEKPVVASRTTAIPEVLDVERRGFGLLVEPENPRELASALVKLLRDEALRRRMVRGAREYVQRQRSWPAVAEQTLCTIRRLTNSGGEEADA